LSFPTQAAAKAKRDLLKVDFENLGTRASAIPDALRLEAVRCSGKLKPYGQSLTDAVNFFVAHLDATERSSTIPDVVIEYIETKRASAKSKRYVDDLKSKLGKLAGAFPESMASEVSAKQIDTWLTSLRLSSRSINSYRTVLNGLFSFGIKRSYLRTNPIAGVERHNVVEEAPSILTPLELLELLSACDPRIVPFVAI
jgi:integrase